MFLLLVPIAVARIILKKHTLWQVIGGAVVSFIVTALVFIAFGYPIYF
jgi:membrane-associated phospholipid phosphatase